jgi:hypothetical protein
MFLLFCTFGPHSPILIASAFSKRQSHPIENSIGDACATGPCQAMIRPYGQQLIANVV